MIAGLKMLFERIVKLINKAPITYLPALLNVIVVRCCKEKCFVRGGLSKTIRIIEDNYYSGDNEVKPPALTKLTCSKCGTIYVLSKNSIHRVCGLRGCVGRLHMLGG